MSPRTTLLTLVASILTAACSSPSTGGPAVVGCEHPGTFSPTGAMLVPRLDHLAVSLASGDVLVAGGQNVASGWLASAEIYDASTGTFSATGSMTTTRVGVGVSATRLSTGKVLIVGGQDASGGIIPTVELYDPAAGTFAPTGSMQVPRSGQTATLLPSGEVLVAGGQDEGSDFLASAELYDPSTGTFAAAGSMTMARSGSMATALASGKVLIAGGAGAQQVCGPPCGHVSLTTAEIYDPALGTFTATGSMTTTSFGSLTTLLPSGKVLFAGGVGPTPSAELYDPATGTFVSTAGLAGDSLVGALLPSGELLVVGMTDASGFVTRAAELYDATHGAFSDTGATATGHGQAPLTLLSTGEVLIAGGQDVGGGDAPLLASAELYCP